MEMSKTKLGAHHTDTLNSMANLALTWKDIGRSTRAIALLEECIQSQRRVLGPYHVYTLSSCFTLKIWMTVIEEPEVEDVDGNVEDMRFGRHGVPEQN